VRKIIVECATSADGYIARKDGSVDWLEQPGLTNDYGMAEFYRTIDTILWGRKTYEVALAFQEKGIPGAGFDPKVKNYVFSRRPPRTPAPGVEFVTQSVPDFAKRLRATRGKHVWMMGGASLIASFLDAGEIDEFSIHLIPVFIGEGIPLVAPRHRTIPLKLLSTRQFPDGVVHLHYSVIRKPARPRGSRRK